MGTIRRILWLGAWSLASSCFGGPTSDWPRGADDEMKPGGGAGPTGPIRADAGVGYLDAGPPSGCVPLAMDEGGVRFAPPILDDVSPEDAAAPDAALHDAAADASPEDGSTSEAGVGSVNDAGAPDATCVR